MSDAENPLDPFKRATTATIRAIAGDDELDVTFGAGLPVVRGGTLRLPLPSVGAEQDEIDAVRAVLAMNLPCGLNTTIRDCIQCTAPMAVRRRKCLSGSSLRASPPSALCVCRALRKTLMRTLRCSASRRPLTPLPQSDAPLSVAVGLLVQQQLTGRELPPSAEHVSQYWREHVMENAGEHIEALRDHVQDQDTFASLCRNIIADLGLPVDLTDPNERKQFRRHGYHGRVGRSGFEIQS